MGLVGECSDLHILRSRMAHCSSSTFWTPALKESGVCESHEIYAYDFDGHGLSDYSGRHNLTMYDLVDDLRDVLEVLELKRVNLLVHSMNGVCMSLVSIASS